MEWWGMRGGGGEMESGEHSLGGIRRHRVGLAFFAKRLRKQCLCRLLLAARAITKASGRASCHTSPTGAKGAGTLAMLKLYGGGRSCFSPIR